jgi:hypothetical protein
MAEDHAPGFPERSLSTAARHGEGLQALGGKLAELVAALAPRDDAPHLRERLAEIEAEHRRLCAEFVEVQERHAELVKLGVAAARLHDVQGREDALVAIEELMVNLVGSEQYAVFERGADGRLLPIGGMGVDWRALPAVTPGQGPLGLAAAENRILLDAAGAGPLVFIPFLVDGRAGGAVALHGLLPQKPALTDFDRELFSILQLHAGLALGHGPAER